jgi:hypothetical protein
MNEKINTRKSGEQTMPMNKELLRADGFTEPEIDLIEMYYNVKKQTGRFSNAGALVMLNGSPRLCCQTAAEIVDALRPGLWLSRYPVGTRHRKHGSRSK